MGISLNRHEKRFASVAAALVIIALAAWAWWTKPEWFETEISPQPTQELLAKPVQKPAEPAQTAIPAPQAGASERAPPTEVKKSKEKKKNYQGLPLVKFKAIREKHEWRNWGAAPYAPSQEEACQKASTAIDGLNMPLAVKAHFKQSLGTTCKGGTEVWLTPHQPLEQMWSGPDAHHKESHVMDKMSVGELPVLKSPDGRTYRKGAVAETAKALSWTFVYEGKTYILYLPLVCFNWSWAFGPPPVVPVEECIELSFNAPVGGKVSWGAATTSGPFPPDKCNAQQQGDGPWTAWYGDCPICVLPAIYVQEMQDVLGGNARIPHKYMYLVTAAKQVLSFGPAVQSAVVYICLEDSAGKKTCGVVLMRPQDWKGRHRVEVPDIWLWEGDARCPPT